MGRPPWADRPKSTVGVILTRPSVEARLAGIFLMKPFILLPLTLSACLASSCATSPHPARSPVRPKPERVELTYSVHFSQIRLNITPELVKHWAKGQGPGRDRGQRQIAAEQFTIIVDHLLSTAPFRTPGFSSDLDPSIHAGTGYVITVTYDKGRTVVRRVGHGRMYQEGKYPRMREWIDQMRDLFRGIAPDRPANTGVERADND